MRLGIMGGTFDPIHYGHLFIAEEARCRFQLSRVLFVTNGSPPHKTGELTDAVHRFEMTRLATDSNAAFYCSTAELNRLGPSYTIDTLEQIADEYPGADLFTITGIDAVAEILTWRRHAEVINRTMFLAAARPGFDLQLLDRRLPPHYRSRVELMDAVALDISSTDIRNRIKSGRPIRYLTPDGVIDYIFEHRLYQPDSAPDDAAV